MSTLLALLLMVAPPLPSQAPFVGQWAPSLAQCDGFDAMVLMGNGRGIVGGEDVEWFAEGPNLLIDQGTNRWSYRVVHISRDRLVIHLIGAPGRRPVQALTFDMVLCPPS